jgi:hypothetical protein
MSSLFSHLDNINFMKFRRLMSISFRDIERPHVYNVVKIVSFTISKHVIPGNLDVEHHQLNVIHS